MGKASAARGVRGCFSQGASGDPAMSGMVGAAAASPVANRFEARAGAHGG